MNHTTKICIVTQFEPNEIDQSKIAFGSFFLMNVKYKYVVHVLTNSEPSKFTKLTETIKPFAKTQFFNENFLVHLYNIKQEFKTIIILNHRSMTIKNIDEKFDFYSNFQMVGQLQYQKEYELLESGFNIPFVVGVFSKGFLMLNNLNFELTDIENFSKTFNISKSYTDFEYIFLSWLCELKFNENYVSNESEYYHNKDLKNLKHIYFSKNSLNIIPWKYNKENTIPYIFYYLKMYYEYSILFKCDDMFSYHIKTNLNNDLEFKDFQSDIEKSLIFRNSFKLFTPLQERYFTVKFF